MSSNSDLICVDNEEVFYAIDDNLKDENIILTLDLRVVYLAKLHGYAVIEIGKVLEEFHSFRMHVDSTLLAASIGKKLEKYILTNNLDKALALSYPVKQIIDSVELATLYLNSVFSEVSFENLYLVKNTKVEFDENLVLHSNFRLLTYCAREITNPDKVKQVKLTKESIYDIVFLSFGEVKKQVKKPIELILNPVTELVSLLKSFLLSSAVNKNIVFSVGCREIDSLRKSISLKKALRVHQFNSYRNFSSKRHCLSNIESCGFHHSNVELSIFYEALINKINSSKSLINYLHSLLSLIIFLTKPSKIIVQTLSAFNLNALVINKIAKDKNIPVYCWMHGGYGAYTSLPGYDVTDFLGTENHLVYGEGAYQSILSEESILRALYPNKKFNVKKLGSHFFLSKRFNHKNKKRNTIVFSLPGPYMPNAYYYGYDRKQDFASYSDDVEHILNLLIEFSNLFEVIVKDYPSGVYKNLFEYITKHRNCKNILYISGERSYHSVIEEASILVYPWVSTSFIEGIRTTADIILFDTSEMHSSAKSILRSCSVFATSNDDFTYKATEYFNNYLFGNCKRTDHIKLRRYFINQTDDQLNDLIKFTCEEI